MTVSPTARQALRDAMERLLTGKPQRTDGRLVKQNLWKEAGISRATMNRAADVLQEWDARIVGSPNGTYQRRSDQEITDLRGDLRRIRAECRELRCQVDAAATVIATLVAENAALREQAVRRSSVVVPFDRSLARRE